MKTVWYPHGLAALSRGEINWATSELRLAILGPDYAPLAIHENFSEVAWTEVTSPNYDVGGKVMTGRTLNVDSTGVDLNASQVTWEESTIEGRYGVIYEAVSGSLVAYVDPETPVFSIDGTFTVSWPNATLRLVVVP